MIESPGSRIPPSSGRRNLIQESLTWAMGLSTAVVLAVMILFWVVVTVTTSGNILRQSQTSADEIAGILVTPMYFLDDLQSKRIAELLLASEKISGVVLTSSFSGKLVDRPGSGTSTIPTQTRIIQDQGQVLGSIELWFGDGELVRTQNLFLILTLSLMIAVAGINLIANRLVIRRRIMTPLNGIAQGIQALAMGRFDHVIPSTPYEDVNSLVKLINGMAGTIQSSDRDLRATLAQLEHSQALLLTILDSVNDTIIGTDLAGTINFFNRSGEQLLGYRAAELVGTQSPLLFHSAAEVEALRRDLERSQGGPLTSFQALVANKRRQWTYLARDGSARTVDLVVSRLGRGDAPSQGFLGVARDLTDQREAERRYHDMMTQAPFGVIVCQEGLIAFANPAYARIMGLRSPEAAVGASFLETLVAEDSAVLGAFAAGRLQGSRAPGTQQVRARTSSLAPLILEVSVEAIRYEGKVSTLFFLEDVTERKVAEARIQELNRDLEDKVAARTEELRVANGQLVEAYTQLETAQRDLVQSEKLSALGHLAAGIAHELNTPLGAIHSANNSLVHYLSNTLDETIEFLLHLGDDERRLYHQVVELSLGREHRMGVSPPREQKKALRADLGALGVEDPLRISELLFDLDLPHLPALLPALFPRAQCEDLLAHAYAQVSMVSLAHIVTVAIEKCTTVIGALRQYLGTQSAQKYAEFEVEHDLEVVLTLMQNKIKSRVSVVRRFSGTKAWGSSAELSQVWMNLINNAVQAMNYEGTLTLTTESRGETTVVGIEDTGPGIPESLQKTIFEPFFTTKASGEGMGLGLDLCRKIVENHRGTIRVNTQPGRTLFEVEIPSVPWE